MNDIIRLLPDSVANQIAAGEVIQRPAAVIKELVENAIDAGADDIRIYIKDAGRTLIQVVDNGCGMTETDARMAFERHATSKIRKADDLFALQTMGFRGEALPSICAIARVEIRTRQADTQLGTHLVIEGSRVESQNPDVCEKGTNIMVKNLFFNQPARRKFLKSDNVELTNIMREFERLALVNNGVKMFIDTGTGKVLDLRKATFKQRISDLWKSNLANQLIPVEADTSIVKISGYISRPEFARRRNALQYLIVNGRNMRHPYFHKAIMSCYESLIATDTMPCYFLKFEVNPADIDVNIHPTKNEIKFENESQIWSILTAAVKASLGKSAAVPSIDFEHDVLPVQPLAPGEEVVRPGLDLTPGYNPFADDFTPGNYYPRETGNSSKSGGERKQHHTETSRSVKGWDRLYNDFINRKETSISASQLVSEMLVHSTLPGVGVEEMANISSPASICLQFALKYIITSTREGVVFIDQYRAHLRILYERFMSRCRAGKGVSQTVLFPETLTIPHELQGAFAEMQPQLCEVGFSFEQTDEGSDNWLITGVPALLEQVSASDIVLRILESVAEGSDAYGRSSSDPSEYLMSRMCLIMARASAIARGRRLAPEEMEDIVAKLFAMPDPAFTPNGHRIFVTLDEDYILGLLR